MFRVSQLIGFMAGAAGAATVEFLGTTVSTAVAANYTFSSVNLGIASGTSRVVVVAFVTNGGGSQDAFSAITVEGVGGVVAQTTGGSGGVLQKAICGTAVATVAADTGTVQVNTSGGASGSGCVIAVYRLNNLQQGTAFDTVTADTGAGTATSVSGSVDIHAHGILIFGVAVRLEVPSGSGATEDDSANATVGYWVGSNQDMSAETARSVSATFGTARAGALSGASFY